MFRQSLSILAAIVATAAVAVSSVYAQTSGTPEQPQAVTLANIKEAIVRAIGGQNGTVEISTTAARFTVKVINGKFADGTPAGREDEAAAIETIVASTISGKAQFKGIVVIVVEYVKHRNGGRSRVVDSIEFRKDTTGAFRHHIT
jgi:hypothetical protein